ncbi:uncharacterized protein LOC113376180 [Ctenocephalides felis]|uniref:uncharacterized protein LOC113376180 n=1 Tax=Ctenocephalides felis TaxID=7515 RepID=UPI000E6E289D|nr:uncharacterized protein LOC113376180 [Ctenocephalides felis]
MPPEKSVPPQKEHKDVAMDKITPYEDALATSVLNLVDTKKLDQIVRKDSLKREPDHTDTDQMSPLSELPIDDGTVQIEQIGFDKSTKDQPSTEHSAQKGTMDVETDKMSSENAKYDATDKEALATSVLIPVDTKKLDQIVRKDSLKREPDDTETDQTSPVSDLPIDDKTVHIKHIKSDESKKEQPITDATDIMLSEKSVPPQKEPKYVAKDKMISVRDVLPQKKAKDDTAHKDDHETYSLEKKPDHTEADQMSPLSELSIDDRTAQIEQTELDKSTKEELFTEHSPQEGTINVETDKMSPVKDVPPQKKHEDVAMNKLTPEKDVSPQEKAKYDATDKEGSCNKCDSLKREPDDTETDQKSPVSELPIDDRTVQIEQIEFDKSIKVQPSTEHSPQKGTINVEADKMSPVKDVPPQKKHEDIAMNKMTPKKDDSPQDKAKYDANR